VASPLDHLLVPRVASLNKIFVARLLDKDIRLRDADDV
jgi:hypothetical protein